MPRKWMALKDDTYTEPFEENVVQTSRRTYSCAEKTVCVSRVEADYSVDLGGSSKCLSEKLKCRSEERFQENSN